MILNQKQERKKKKDKPFYGFDPELGFWGVPNLKQRIKNSLNPSFDLEIIHNEDGIRNAPYKSSVSDGSILCIGGSHTWGGGIKQEDRYSDLLAQRTNRQVMNMGQCSLGIDQVAIAILNRAKKYNPKVIVVEQYPWAVTRVLNHYVNGYVKPSFYLDANNDLKLKKVPRSAHFLLFRKIIGSFYSYRKEFKEFQGGIDLSENYDPLADPIFCYWKIHYYDYCYSLLEKIILICRDYCQQNNIQLFFALGAIQQQFSGKSRSRLIDYDLPRKRLGNILEKSGIAYVDMTETMLKEHSSEDPVIFEDGHINTKGHNVFATVLQKELEDRSWI